MNKGVSVPGFALASYNAASPTQTKNEKKNKTAD
jgi:hypothetical protein